MRRLVVIRDLPGLRPRPPGVLTVPLFRKAGHCSHGHAPGDGKSITISGARERTADKHEDRCKRPRLLNHPGFLGRIVCCAGCGQKVC